MSQSDWETFWTQPKAEFSMKLAVSSPLTMFLEGVRFFSGVEAFDGNAVFSETSSKPKFMNCW